MIPLHLRIAGFLSYRDPVDLDFSGFDLACISGENGAGKSSLLDAMTWALFGLARRRDDAIINLQSKAAEVIFVFQYEGNLYRIQRGLPRGKTTILEFQVLAGNDPEVAASARPNPRGTGPLLHLPTKPNWRPLTERTMRETQDRIEQTLHLDYDTFVNASFFLQGRADQFTQQNASKRKEVLGNILGLEIWEQYKLRAADRRKRFEEDLSLTDQRIAEIDLELAEEETRKKRLEELETQLKQLAAARRNQAGALENIRATAAALEQQERLVASLGNALERAHTQLNGMRERLKERETLREAETGLVGRADEIQSAHKAWRQTVRELESWEKTASAFREHDQARAPLLAEIASEKARLQEEQRNLKQREEQMAENRAALNTLEDEIRAATQRFEEAEAKVKQRQALEEQRSAARETQARLQAENEGLKAEMKAIRGRMDALQSASGATCPLCGQVLSPEHRESTLNQLQAEGTAKGDQFRGNSTLLDSTIASQKELEAALAPLSSADGERLAYSNALAQLQERRQTLEAVIQEWESEGRKHLQELDKDLTREHYAMGARKELAKVDKYLAGLGYDAAAHDRTRTLELAQRSADEDFRKLETARAALAPLENEIASLKSDITSREAEMAAQQAEFDTASASLERARTQTPDLDEAERTLFELSEQENRLNQDVGAARQKVLVLDELRERKAGYSDQRNVLATQINHHKALERAFGKDGVPALLIEQALPEIESKANELLDRLSEGKMSVRFLTQASYKDKKREDLKETLEIQISDGSGARDYEMYSGGEAFRVDFAIRLALSEVLAQRKGARLQTLVIDEGFGSQDLQGRQRLIEAINMVKQDFAKILVITHLDELKDAFPTRIEVEKTPQGSRARIM